MKPQISNIDDASVRAAMEQVADDVAVRFGALADLFTSWREPKVARQVVDSLLAADGNSFRGLFDNFELPMLGVCPWIREVIEVVVATIETVTVWRLRTNLTPAEKQLYLMLALQFRQSNGTSPHVISSGQMLITNPPGPGPLIPSGLFLNALIAAGLVVSSEEAVENAGLQQVLAPWGRVCV